MKTKNTDVTILELGSGSWETITRQAYDVLARAEREQIRVYVRMLLNSSIEPLQADFPDLQLASFDALYEEADDWETLYQNIMQHICTQTTSEPLIYAALEIDPFVQGIQLLDATALAILSREEIV